tara:strand:+ start:297 stop:548 length:252 start_codon:yes stop_codon:yes gene_type:complete
MKTPLNKYITGDDRRASAKKLETELGEAASKVNTYYQAPSRKSPLHMLGINPDTPLHKKGRCWEGYEPVPGVKPYEKGSCRKK